MKEQVRIGLSTPSRTPLLTMALMLAAALETSKQPESLHKNTQSITIRPFALFRLP